MIKDINEDIEGEISLKKDEYLIQELIFYGIKQSESNILSK